MRYVTISVKIPRELKELMDKYGIKPSAVIRRALEEEVKKKILEEAENKVKGLVPKVAHISDEEIARIIREDRDGR
jgi:post-segregation antitoxin (ccd killing protein)